MWQVIGSFIGKYLGLLIYPPAAVMISAVLTLWCIRVLPRLGMIDVPRGRHEHAKPTPLGGGIAIVVGFFAVSLIFALENRAAHPEVLRTLGHFALPSAVIVITGLFDDRYELSSWVKLFAQIVAGVLVYLLNDGFSSNLYHIKLGWFSLPLTVIWVVGIINAFNLIDGLDGLAAGLACVASVTLTVWGMSLGGNPGYAALSMIFCGACLGFLFFNFSPAKIFMGDTGSMFLGLFFASLCCRYTSRAATITSLLVPLLAIGVPIFDVFLAIWRRLMRRIINPQSGGIMEGDHDHLHHRLMKKTGSQSKTALLLYLLMALIGMGAVCAVMVKGVFPGAIYIVLLGGVFLAIRLADIEFLDSFGCIAKGVKRPSRRLLLVIVHPLIDYALISLAYVAVCGFVFRNDVEFPATYGYLIFCIPLMLTLYISGIYRTYWLRAGINRYHIFFKMLLLGGCCELVMIYLMERYCHFFRIADPLRLYGGYFFFFMMVLILVGTERFLVRYLESFGLRSLYLKVRAEEIRERRLVLIGGGVACRLFVINLFCRNYMQLPLVVSGIVDDDPSLRRLNVYGFPVLGNTDALEDIYRKEPFDMLVVTTAISEESLDKLRAFVKAHDIQLGVFHAETCFCTPETLAAEVEKLVPPPSGENEEEQL